MRHGAIRAETSEDVFHIDDGVVHHFAEKAIEAGDHHVECGATPVEHQGGRHQREEWRSGCSDVVYATLIVILASLPVFFLDGLYSDFKFLRLTTLV